MGELGHLPASARSGIKIAQFGPDFDIDIYHQRLSTLLDAPETPALPATAPVSVDPDDVAPVSVAGGGHSLSQGSRDGRPAAPKLGFQISMTSNTTKTVFDAAAYSPPAALQQVLRGSYRGGRQNSNAMVQILSLGPSRAGLPLHVHDESFLHLLGGLKLWVLFPPSGMHNQEESPDLAALCLKSPSDTVPHLIRLLKDPATTPDLHVCLQVCPAPLVWGICLFVCCALPARDRGDHIIVTLLATILGCAGAKRRNVSAQFVVARDPQHWRGVRSWVQSHRFLL